ncbi:MAG: hypothetical protein JO276_12645 [Sphingomonadaceae bacterium]|nr:hypothetical protein [Sphingomonadaceae bacterium]
MRPRSIIRFEQVVLLAFGLGIVNACLEWKALLARMHPPYPVATLCASQLLYFGPYALLIWLISRKGSAVARGIFAALVVLVGFIYLATLPAFSDMSVSTILAAAQCLLTLGSLSLIFRRDTDPWFRNERPIDPEVFR